VRKKNRLSEKKGKEGLLSGNKGNISIEKEKKARGTKKGHRRKRG